MRGGSRRRPEAARAAHAQRRRQWLATPESWAQRRMSRAASATAAVAAAPTGAAAAGFTLAADFAAAGLAALGLAELGLAAAGLMCWKEEIGGRWAVGEVCLAAAALEDLVDAPCPLTLAGEATIAAAAGLLGAAASGSLIVTSQAAVAVLVTLNHFERI